MENSNNVFDLFSPDKLIASREIKSDNTFSRLVTLDYSNIDPIVQSVFENNRNYSKLPISILTVAAPTSSSIRELYAYWLIDYLENGGKHPTKIAGLEFLTNTNVALTPPGLYLWPKPYQIRVGRTDNQHENSPGEYILAWVVYVNGKTSRTLQSFSKMVASTVIEIETDEQVKSNNPLLSEDIAEMHMKFIRQLGEINLLPARMPPPHDITVTLKSFQDYLQWTVDTFNTAQLSKGRLGIAPPKQNIKMNDTSFEATPVVLKAHQNAGTLPENGQGHATSQTVNPEKNVAIDPCEEHQCTLKLYAADVGITIWIENTMNKDNISDMLKMMDAYMKFTEQHGICKETQELVHILHQYTSELHNMFDNYVCFSGDQDTRQMARFFAVAKGRAEKVLQGKNHVHYHFTSSLLEKCCEKIMLIFQQDNDNIIQMEEMLVNEVYRQVLDAYHEKMKKILPTVDPSKVENVHRKLSKVCLGMLTRCLDYSAKLNYVRSQHLRKLDEDMNIRFQKIVETLPKPVATPVMQLSDRDIINKCVSMYVDEIQKISKQFSAGTRQERKRFHDGIATKLIENLSDKSLIKELCTRLNSYFLHLNEVCEQALENNSNDQDKLTFGGGDGNPATLSIYLTPETVRVLVTTDRGDMVLQFGPRLLHYFPPILAVTHGNKFTFGWDAFKEIKERPDSIRYKGQVMHYVLNTMENPQVSERMLTDLFLNLKHQAQQGFKATVPYAKALVVVPSWFDHENRGRIRDACCRAKFLQTFMVSEASLAAHLVLSDLPSNNPSEDTDAVVVSLTENQVDVRIYCREPPVSGNDSLVKLVAISRIEEGKSIDKNNAKAGENVKNIICKVYKNALNQIDGGGSKKKVCAVICESRECLVPLRAFLEQRKEITSIRNLREDDHTPNAILRLSRKPEEIGSLLMDYCMPPTFSVEGQVEVNVDDDDDDESSSDDKTLLKREQLVEKCKKIRQQIQTGSVRLGVLTKKLVTRAVENAEATAADGQAKMEDLQEQENEIDEIIVEYKFSC